MGIYIFNWDILKKYLTEDENDPNSENDFGKNVIPALLRDNRRMYAYRFSGYWKDVGTISSLWQANMEVLDPTHSGINLFDENWKIYSRNSGRSCQRIGTDADIVNSMITEGCQVDGTVKNSHPVSPALWSKRAPLLKQPLLWAALSSRLAQRSNTASWPKMSPSKRVLPWAKCRKAA